MAFGNRPIVKEEKPGQYAICRCGEADSFPYCDGSHRGTDKRPVKVVLDTAKTVAWCGCGRTGNAPYCDGSHKGC